MFLDSGILYLYVSPFSILVLKFRCKFPSLFPWLSILFIRYAIRHSLWADRVVVILPYFSDTTVFLVAVSNNVSYILRIPWFGNLQASYLRPVCPNFFIVWCSLEWLIAFSYCHHSLGRHSSIAGSRRLHTEPLCSVWYFMYGCSSYELYVSTRLCSILQKPLRLSDPNFT